MIKRKGTVIPKTEGFIYEIEQFDKEILDQFLEAREGTFGIEQCFNELYAYVPNTERLNYPSINKSWENLSDELEFSSLYELQLSDHAFLPLHLKDTIDLLSNEEVFTQILITKLNGNWRDKIITQYEEYLKGNDFAVNNKLINKLQNKLLSGLSKLGNFNFKREYSQEVEDKILSPHYKVEVRFIVFSNPNQFEMEMNEQLRKLNYQNQLDLVKVDDKDKEYLFKCILKREFQSHINNQLSYKEVQCLFPFDIPKQKISPRTPIVAHQVQSTGELIDLLPYSQTSTRDIDDTVAKQLVDSFKRTKISNKQVKVNSVNRGATLQKITVNIPNDVVYTNIEKNIKNIQASLGKDSISMEIGDIPDTIDFYIPCDNRDVVYLRDILSSEEFVEYVKSATIPLILGEDSIGEPLFSDLAELKHILIAGATGSGKSVYLNALILTMIMYKSPSELQLILIDPKQVELGQFEQFPHTAKFISNVDKAKDTFEALIDEMENRYTLMADSGCRNIAQYNSKNKKQLPYIVCIVDELSDLMDTHGKEVEGCIIRLAQKARAAGIHLILCTQKPSADVITSRIKSNLPSAISFRLKAQSDYRTCFGKGSPVNLIGKGDGVAMLEGSKKEFVRFQAPVIDLDEMNVTDIIEQMADNYDGMENNYEIVEKEELIDQIKRIIACTGETRSSVLREEMGIRGEIASDLVKQLVDEEWLVKEGKSYKLVASEEELNKWREVAE